MKVPGKFYKPILLAMLLLFVALSALAEVPVRVSIKFILNAAGNRPSVGNLNTDTQIIAEFDAGESMLRQNLSEFSLHNMEGADTIVELDDVSQWYTSASDATNRDNLRAAAMADPTTYGWRSDAINIYINGGTNSAISKFPPDNDIILMNQGCGSTPSCILHELGHSLDLRHTHEPNGDDCPDTIMDNEGWSKNDVAQNNYGCNYADCTSAQQAAVDLVFNNVMSYHVSEPQNLLSGCQKNRVSSQGDLDRGWLLTKDPIYVDENAEQWPLENGRWSWKYTTLQEAVDAGGLSGKVMVLEQGNYALGTMIDANVEIVTRSGPSYIEPPGAQLYKLPVDLENSDNPEVSQAVIEVQRNDKAARQALKAAAKEARKTEKAADKSRIQAAGKEKHRKLKKNAYLHLLKAEKAASGKEKIAIQLELAERYRDDNNCNQAIVYFNLVAENTVQEHLATKALYEVKQCEQRLAEKGEYGHEKGK